MNASEEPIIAVEIRNVKIGTAVLYVSNVHLEWNQMVKDLNVSILMNANIMFVIRMLLVQIPSVRLDVNAILVLPVTEIWFHNHLRGNCCRDIAIYEGKTVTSIYFTTNGRHQKKAFNPL